jgi:hypothetical protein
MAKRRLTDEERSLHKRVSTNDYQRRKRESIAPQPCEVCGYEPAQCHHIDYSDPTRRMWLCDLHHAQTHSQFGKPAPLDWMADIRAAQARIDAQRLALRAARELAARPTSTDQAAS